MYSVLRARASARRIPLRGEMLVLTTPARRTTRDQWPEHDNAYNCSATPGWSSCPAGLIDHEIYQVCRREWPLPPSIPGHDHASRLVSRESARPIGRTVA